MMARGLDSEAVAVIEHYLARLSKALGSRDRTTQDVVDEVRDGLYAAAEGHVARGLPAAGAGRAALRECGALEQLAPVMVADAIATRTRRTALAILSTGPVVAALWAAAVLAGPASPWRAGDASPWRTALPWLGFGVVLTVACSLTAHSAVSGLGRHRPRLAHVAALAAAVSCVGTDLAGVTFIAVWALAGRGGIAWLAAAAAAVSCARIIVAGDRIRRLRSAVPA